MAILEENDVLFAHKALNIIAGMTDATKRVAGAIIDHFNKQTGQCDPGIERLASLLGIDRATVLRATEKLHDLGLIEKSSHGGKNHRAAYLPNWQRFRAFVEEWDALMKAAKAERTAQTASAKVAALRHKPFEVTNRMNQSKRCPWKRRSQSRRR